jgi:hypothetical protein
MRGEEPGMAAPHSATTGERRSETTIDPVWAVVLAALSLGAAFIHAAAVAEFADVSPLAQLFAVSAVIGGAWALLVIARPTRDTLAVGLVVNSVFVAAYFLSHVIALPVLGLAERQSVGFQGVTCVLLEAALIGATGYLLAPRSVVPSFRKLSLVPAGALLVGAMLIAVPALAAGNDQTKAAPAAGNAKATNAQTASAATTHVHGVSAGSVNAASQARADKLLAATKKDLPTWSDYRTAEADGFVSIGDALTGFEHFVNAQFSATPATLDAKRPESLVYTVNRDGTKKLASAMYIAAPGTNIKDVPDVGGNPWHIHDNLCWDATGTHLAGISVNGRCIPGGTLGVTAPMIHVWIVPNACGQFANLENSASVRGDVSRRGGVVAAGLAKGFGADGAATNADGSPNCSHTHA